MDFSHVFPKVMYDKSEYISNSKLKIHKEAKLLELKNIKSGGMNIIEKDVCIHADLGIVVIGRQSVIKNGTSITPSSQIIDEDGYLKQ